MANDTNECYLCEWGSTVTALSVTASGSSAVLAARRKLFVVDLDQPQEPSRTLSHQSRWDVGVIECCPHPSQRSFVAFTCNQNTLVWNLDSEHSPLHATLQMHTRAVNDISWSGFNPDLLASCSSDTYVHVWDVRSPKTASTSFCAWTAGATQVVWSRHREFSLASAHEGEVRVWDTRKGSTPVMVIHAHHQAILALDWSPNKESELLSGSLDHSVKLWDISQPNEPLKDIQRSGPIRKAQFIPDSNNIVLSESGPESIYDLQLWDTEEPEPRLVHSYRGHGAEVVDFCYLHPAGRRAQLVSWSKDLTLRKWPLLSQSSRRGAPRLAGRKSPEYHPKREPNAARWEVEEILSQYHFVVLLSENVNHREWALRVDTGFEDSVTMRVRYPPSGLHPEITLQPPGTPLDAVVQEAVECHEGPGGVLSTCFRAIHEANFSVGPSTDQGMTSFEETDFAPFNGMSGLSVASDESLEAAFLPTGCVIPCPRTSAATFSSTGELVRFYNFPRRSGTDEHASTMPRTYEHLKTWVQERYQSPMFGPDYALDVITRSLFFPQEHEEAPFELGGASSHVLNTTVTMVNPEPGLLLNRRLAETCVLPGALSPEDVCLCNQKQASTVARPDLVQLWKALGLIIQQVQAQPKTAAQCSSPWALHPFGTSLVTKFIEHFLLSRDVQTLALLSAVLLSVTTTQQTPNGPVELSLVHPSFQNAAAWWRYEYAKTLHQLGMFQQHAEMLKLVGPAISYGEEPQLPQLIGACGECHSKLTPGQNDCGNCTAEALVVCVICRRRIVGAASVCLECGHVGHLEHVMAWFSEEIVCPHPGCGCVCQTVSAHAMFAGSNSKT